MHFSASTDAGLFLGIAPTGHIFAHTPHCVQLLLAFGLKGTPKMTTLVQNIEFNQNQKLG